MEKDIDSNYAEIRETVGIGVASLSSRLAKLEKDSKIK